jgi:hypothetical protein
MLAGEVVNSLKMNNQHVDPPKHIRELLLIFGMIVFLASCSHFPVREPGISSDALESYKNNLLQWNSLASCDNRLRPVSPLPLGQFELPLEELNLLNALFLIGFSVVSDATAEPGYRTEYIQNNAAFNDSGHREVIIRFDVPKKADHEDPRTGGVLLDGNGWVLTVAHPFSNPSLEQVPLYARVGEDRFWYSADHRMIARSSNLALVHFALPRNNLIAPAFAQAEQGDPAFIGFKGTEEKILIEKTEETLQLGESLVYGANLVSRSVEPGESLISGIPLVNKRGEILGLYYYQSLDGRFSGYAGWKELPGLIDSMIHLLHREMLSDLRRQNS